MASIKISELTAITTAAQSDVLVINDSSNNTRKITFSDLTAPFVELLGNQVISGDISITGTFSASGNVTLGTDVLYVAAADDRVGIGYASPTYTMEVQGDALQLRDNTTLRFADADSSNAVTFDVSATLPSSTAYLLPDAYPASSGYVLASSDSGALSWVANGGGSAPGGLTNYVQFNVGGVFTGDIDFQYDPATDILSASFFRGDIDNADGNLTVKGGSSAGSVTLNCEQNSHGVTLLSPPHSSNATWTLELPDTVGSNGQLLTTNGTSKLSWSSALTNPMTTEGDLITGAVGGVAARLALGSATQVLTVNGAGNAVEWATPAAATAAGANTQLQYNSSGSFAGSASLTFDGTILTSSGLSVTGDTTLGNNTTDTITFTGEIDSHYIPTTNAAYDLGDAEHKIRHLFLSDTSLKIGSGSSSAIAVEVGASGSDNLLVSTGIEVNSNILPTAPEASDLGAVGLTWNNVYANIGHFTTLNATGAINFAALADYPDDAAAAGGGIAVGQLYRNGSAVMVRVA